MLADLIRPIQESCNDRVYRHNKYCFIIDNRPRKTVALHLIQRVKEVFYDLLSNVICLCNGLHYLQRHCNTNSTYPTLYSYLGLEAVCMFWLLIYIYIYIIYSNNNNI